MKIALHFVFTFIIISNCRGGEKSVSEEINGYEIKLTQDDRELQINIGKGVKGHHNDPLYFSEAEMPIYKAAMEKFLEWAETAKKKKVASFEKEITDKEVLPVLKTLEEPESRWPKISMAVNQAGKVVLNVKGLFHSTWEEAEVRDLLVIFDRIPMIRKKFESDTLFK